VLRAIGLTVSQAEESLRFCIGRYTTDGDIREAVELISDGLANPATEGLHKLHES
jgi:cysteine sulfinate desulfinase/cysteine desulfurase-like protein